ncbi:SAF domain-containing protein [Gordonia neofelifaecis]|uniref:SAF domain-containing protein n=1 Tax=Gordonia neofelifaecis NRRL B-59395 TaxID=644548 RepID=F1YKR8_9ACTN|nr:SAF domain-containing protein [Gordonia neofelifaecis]EGD54712.1 SAF domain-containing protein [Gordonia neofelifaecis NRRL B-59395]
MALLLVIAATASVVYSHRRPDAPRVLTAAADLRPGTVLTADDLTSVPMPAATVPASALRDTGKAVGQRLTGPVTRGEIITETRLLTSRLAAQLTGSSTARLVPVRPADESVATLVRQGDTVDVLDADAAVLARGAVVAATPSAVSNRGIGGASSPILLAMNEQSAHEVAATGLGMALALVLH